MRRSTANEKVHNAMQELIEHINDVKGIKSILKFLFIIY